jgi:hypothetical protein
MSVWRIGGLVGQMGRFLAELHEARSRPGRARRTPALAPPPLYRFPYSVKT